MIKESDWQALNRTLLELYGIEDEQEFMKKVLYLFHILVPYTQGFFLSYTSNYQIELDHSVYDGMSDAVFQEYAGYYHEKDYLKFTFDLTRRTMLYRDTDVMEESIRVKTEIYKNYLQPNNIPYCAGILFADGERITGLMSLFRSRELGDFSDKDLYIFNVLKDHLSNMFHKLRKRNQLHFESKQDKLDKFVAQHGISNREKEIIQHFMKGETYTQIGEMLTISESTVKKHIHNIYDKTGAVNRIQLMAMLE
jgi:DNA-binding CsgD family transcriptional regulator